MSNIECRSKVFYLLMYRGNVLVMLAKAGIQSTQNRIFWIPAFAGMTVYIAINSPTAQLNRVKSGFKALDRVRGSR